MKKALNLLFLLTFQLSTAISQVPQFDWAHHFGGTESDGGRPIITDHQNNVYVTGHFNGTVDFDPGPGVTNLVSGSNGGVFVQKLNTDGDLIWARVFPEGPLMQVTSLALDHANNLIIGGYFAGTRVFQTVDGTSTISANHIDAFIVKMNADGDFIWAKSFGNTNDDMDIPDSDRLNALTVDASGNIYSTGYFYGTADFDPGTGTANLSSVGYSDIFIHKLNPEGEYIWAKQVGSAGYDEGVSLSTHENNLLVTGLFQENADFNPSSGINQLFSKGFSDIFLLSLSADGDFNWVNAFGSTAADRGMGVVTDNTGAIYLTGSFDGEIDLDPGPATNLFPADNETNFFILKLNSAGAFTWGKTFSGTGINYSTAITAYHGYGTLVGGFFEGTVDFDPGNGIHNLTAAGEGDIFLVYLDQDGDLIWAGSFGSDAQFIDYISGLTTDNIGNVYSTGTMWQTVDFDCGPGVAELTSNGMADMYILKLTSDVVSVKEHSLSELKLSPNPSNEFVSISAENLSNCRVIVFNTLGTIVLEKELSSSDYELDIRSLATGTYVIRLSNQHDSQHRTLIKTN